MTSSVTTQSPVHDNGFVEMEQCSAGGQHCEGSANGAAPNGRGGQPILLAPTIQLVGGEPPESLENSGGMGAQPPSSDHFLDRSLGDSTTGASFSSYKRDNSDAEIEANRLEIQPESDIFEVDDFFGAPAAEPEFLCDWSPRDKPWDQHRAEADQIAAIYRRHPEFASIAGRIELCSLMLGFGWAPNREDASVLTLKLREARFCRVRHCPICQWRRALMWMARFLAALPQILGLYPNARFVFLTLTRRNVPVGELRGALREMSKAWERLSQRKPFKVVLGWIRTTEVTHGKDGAAHPHFHALLLVPASYFTKNYLKHSQWVAMWRAALRVPYDPIVDVRIVRNQSQRDGITAAVRETLKYAVKPGDMKASDEWFWELTRQLHKLRFVAAGGALKSVLRPGDETEQDLLLLRESEMPQERASTYFRWREQVKRYGRTGTPKYD